VLRSREDSSFPAGNQLKQDTAVLRDLFRLPEIANPVAASVAHCSDPVRDETLSSASDPAWTNCVMCCQLNLRSTSKLARPSRDPEVLTRARPRGAIWRLTVVGEVGPPSRARCLTTRRLLAMRFWRLPPTSTVKTRCLPFGRTAAVSTVAAPRPVGRSVEKVAQALRVAAAAQRNQRLGLDQADALAVEAELLTNLFKGTRRLAV